MSRVPTIEISPGGAYLLAHPQAQQIVEKNLFAEQDKYYPHTLVSVLYAILHPGIILNISEPPDKLTETEWLLNAAGLYAGIKPGNRLTVTEVMDLVNKPVFSE